MSRLDPSWKPERKFEDEVVDMFRALHYPFAISKTALAAVGTSHTWPPLLAALTWLVDLVEYDAAQQKGPERAQFNEYATGAYGLFLAGDDDACLELRSKLEAAFAAAESDAEREAAVARALRDDRREQAQRFRDDAGRLAPTVERRARLSAEKALLMERVAATAKSAATHERRAASSAALAAERRRTAASVRGRAEAARDARERIAEDADAARRLALEAESLKADDAAARARLADLEETARDALRAFDEDFGLALAASKDYHRSARALQLVPASAKNADGRDLSLALAATPELNADVVALLRRAASNFEGLSIAATKARELVRPALAELLEALRARSLEVRRRLAAAKAELEKAAFARDDMTADVEAAVADLESSEARLSRDADRRHRGSAAAAHDAKRLRDEADGLAKRLESRRDALDAKRADVQAVEAAAQADANTRANLLVRLRAELGCLADQCALLAQASRDNRERLRPHLDQANLVLHRDGAFLDRNKANPAPSTPPKGLALLPGAA